MAPLKGRCYCGAVAYELNVPLSEISSGGVLCHCRTCQQLHTDRSYNIATDLTALEVTKGSPSIFHDSMTDSGQAIHRAFCGTCGSALYSTPDSMPGKVFVKVGSLENASEIKPSAEIYIESVIPSLSLQKDVSKGLKHFEGMMSKEVEV
ncbi:Mss4-like protein [Leucosporidium creatinivorum]|uniref:Mss4-like protein n=1 Tax=Leucosporidium creatinivorum TaxID=106004 RepID=A0A1Y2D6H7_9BASI|nr:Mss4-like protein [Leucosporidium creatinivorum]